MQAKNGRDDFAAGELFTALCRRRSDWRHSGDYFGIFDQRIGSCSALNAAIRRSWQMSNGPAVTSTTSIRNVVGDGTVREDDTRRERVAAEVFRAYQTIPTPDWVKLTRATDEIPLAARRPTPEMVATQRSIGEAED